MAQELNGFPDEMLEKCSQVPAAESWGWAEESGAGAGRAEGMTTPGQREHVVPSVRTQPPSPLPPAAHAGGWCSMEAVAPGQGWGAVGWGGDGGGWRGRTPPVRRLQERPRMPQPLNPQGHTAVTFVLSPDLPAFDSEFISHTDVPSWRDSTPAIRTDYLFIHMD